MSACMVLERMLQSQGFGTRKACRAMVRQGLVRVHGILEADPFVEVPLTNLDFSVGDIAWHYQEKAYILLNKPAGFECSRAAMHHPSVLSLLPEPLRARGVQPVGRLDEDTTGLLLLSDDGPFIHRLTSPKHHVAKVYAVTTKHPVTAGQIAALCQGVQLHDTPEPVKAAACEQVSSHLLHLTLTEGRYHQVKRMLAAAGNRVEGLRRIRLGGLSLPDDLPESGWRWLDDAALQQIDAGGRLNR